MRITVLTLFPNWFDGPFGESMIQRGRDNGALEIELVNFRDFATDRHRTVDDAPYGGGGGMVLKAPPLAAALDATAGAPGSEGRAHVIYTSPAGAPFTQRRAEELAKLPRVAIICGHYEGLDQRLIDSRVDEEISIGDYVLTGGEIAAMAIVDAVARLLPGVLGNEAGARDDSIATGLLEAPQYTRPEVFEGRPVPDILLSGHHAKVAAWRARQSEQLTRQRRPDLWQAHQDAKFRK
ncbi:MAG: tRNA (guanosine(37)-N1)-methyltransferase TrmD [Candidatus Sumerlaeia bacterium]|nr:tRNA (guanosine(37)-N1)-methyltransferase TrmD [Candidatus Sumerlaeia bacterium]